VGSRIHRRAFLSGSGAALAWAALAGAGLGGCAKLARRGPGARDGGVYLVPGYRADVARFRGRPAREASFLRRTLPAGWEGPVTLVTRVDERDGAVRRTLLPVEGHAICVRPDGQSAFWSSLNGETLVSFDPETLALGRLVSPVAGHVGGGHAVYTPDGRHLVGTERRRHGPYRGRPGLHHGLLTVRDAETLAVVERHSCGGINPHEVALLEDGRHAAVSNYGNTRVPEADERYDTIASSVTVVELASGKVVYEHVEPDRSLQVRHVAAHRLDRIAAILVHNVPPEDVPGAFDDRDRVYEPDLTTDPGNAYFPAPLVRHDASGGSAEPQRILPADPMLARQGQTVVYDALHDRMLATFASSHCVLAVSGATGRIERVIRTDRLGLRYPRGLALHPDGEHYVVSGSWRDLALFRRRDHSPVPERSLHTVFFDHSHMTVFAPPGQPSA